MGTIDRLLAATLAVGLAPLALGAAETKQDLTKKLWPKARIERALEEIAELKAAGMMSADHYRRKKAMLEARLAFEELPEICTTSDMNGYMEVMAMAPYLNYATFNNGWDGIDDHNRGRRLVNDKFLAELVDKTGAIPYFVNTGKGRFPFGFFFWKMSKYGVVGKVEWFYNLEGTGGGPGSVVKLEGTRIIPTLDYELSREGADDLKYLLKLEKLIAEADRAGKAQAEARAAAEFLEALEDSIIPNWTAYTQGGMKWPADGMERLDPEKAASLGSLNALRRSVAEHVIAINAAMKKH